MKPIPSVTPINVIHMLLCKIAVKGYTHWSRSAIIATAVVKIAEDRNRTTVRFIGSTSFAPLSDIKIDTVLDSKRELEKAVEIAVAVADMAAVVPTYSPSEGNSIAYTSGTLEAILIRTTRE